MRGNARRAGAFILSGLIITDERMESMRLIRLVNNWWECPVCYNLYRFKKDAIEDGCACTAHTLRIEVRGLGRGFGCGVFKSFKIDFDQQVNISWLENIIKMGIKTTSQQAVQADANNCPLRCVCLESTVECHNLGCLDRSTA